MINNKFFSQVQTAILANQTSNSSIAGNMFNDQNIYSTLTHLGKGITQTGIKAKNCNMTNIYNANSFWCCNTGVEWYADNVYAKSDILENNFNGCINGLMFAQQENPRTNTSPSINSDTSYVIQLDIKCNLFEQDSLAIVGSGKLMDQGSAISGVRNKFVNNVNWDIATQNYFNYLYPYSVGDVYHPDKSSANLLHKLIVLNNDSNISLGTKIGGSSSCSNGLFVYKDNSIENNIKTPFDVLIFPNPVDKGILNILFSDIPVEIIYLELYNSIGKRILNRNLFLKESTISTQNIAKGFYYLKLSNNSFRKTYKIIIQ